MNLKFLGLCLLLMSATSVAATVGEMAPDFEVTTQNGDVFRLSDYRGQKPVYVVFWNTWCSYCVKRTPRYIKLQEQFGDKVQIIAINTSWRDSPEEMRSFEAHHHVNYSTAFDADEVITDRYRVYNIPTEFIVDTYGIIRYRDGVPEYLAAHLADLQMPYVPSETAAPLVCTP
jgi:peroxiredoxin